MKKDKINQQWKEKISYKGEQMEVWYAQPEDWADTKVVIHATTHEGLLWELARIKKYLNLSN